MGFLSEEEKAFIRKYMGCVAHLANNFKEPLDPRIESLLEVIHVSLMEQLTLDKKYEHRPVASQDDRFLDEMEIPSADDLRRMMGGEL
jgi:hypothetical protein